MIDRATKPGNSITVTVGGRPYRTWIDDYGTQRFPANKLTRYLLDTYQIDLNQLAIAYAHEMFTQEEYLHFYMGLGYSVSGLSELSMFEDLEIDNPLWGE